LGERGDVPTPRALWFEPDARVLGAPFFLMERVEGETLPTLHHSQGLLARSPPREREALWLSAIQNLAKVHQVVDPRLDFLARPDLGATGVDQELAYWADYMHWTGAPVRTSQERALQWLHDHLPADRRTGLAWGDARPGNMIFRDQACQAVIDWETVSLGSAEVDLGWWIFYDWYVSEGMGIPRLEGLGDREATIRAGEHFAGRKAIALDWHEVFGAWRFSLIVDRTRVLAQQINQAAAKPAREADLIGERLERLMAG
jgi:aminoglycoside phosphotransferase (APT) family kinase protein